MQRAAETKLVDKDRELLDANKTHEAQIQAMEQDLEKAKSAALKKAKDDESKAEKLASDLKDSKEELVKANAEIGSLETSATDAEERHTTALKTKVNELKFKEESHAAELRVAQEEAAVKYRELEAKFQEMSLSKVLW